MRRWLILLLCIPAAHAGTAQSPDIVDTSGDAGSLPCSAAVDIVAFWATWAFEGVEFHYRFADLSALEDYATAHDMAGRCFYSHADFRAHVDGKQINESVYMDHNVNPAYASGWRFKLSDAGTELTGEVDVAANEITVTIPYSRLGEPRAGDRIGAFRIQASTTLEGQGVTGTTDWAPEGSEACDCWVPFGSPSNGTDRPVSPDPRTANPDENDETTTVPPESAKAPGAALPWLGAALLVALRGRARQRRGDGAPPR